VRDVETVNNQPTPTQVSPWRLLWVWTVVGIQSFGGGTATLYLIRRVAVERYAWLTDDEFTQYWGICQIAPGINILGLVILIGWRVKGVAGAVLALTGLLVPSAAITVALTAAYSSIRELPLIQSAIAGVVPATVGLGLLLAYTLVRPLLSTANRDGSATRILAAAILLGSALAAMLTRAPAVAILWGAGAVSALVQWQHAEHQRGSE
jgi:chromate transporter